jgi:ubiquinone/menaquinone biosynthesis C-methylase UbiE
LLAAATAEIVGRLSEWELIGPGRVVLDLGCGIGRVAAALSPAVEAVIGLDISANMIAEARRRCAGLANASFEVSSGCDLASIAAASVDLVLAVDVFPYLVRSGLASTHLRESRRVLKRGGQAVILNYSYQGAIAEQRST